VQRHGQGRELGGAYQVCAKQQCLKESHHEDIMRKIIIIIIVVIFSFMSLLYVFLFFDTYPLKAIHTTMHHDKYDIIVFSRIRPTVILNGRSLYADVWRNGRKNHRYYIIHLDDFEEYEWRLSSITILPDTEELEVDFGEDSIGLRKKRYKLAK
jgi:hypothetical protein